jgi:hypothetical protein
MGGIVYGFCKEIKLPLYKYYCPSLSKCFNEKREKDAIEESI